LRHAAAGLPIHRRDRPARGLLDPSLFSAAMACRNVGFFYRTRDRPERGLLMNRQNLRFFETGTILA